MPKGKAPHSGDQLEDIKRLLIALLLKLGANSQEIGLAPGVDSSAIRKMFPVKKISKVDLVGTK